MKRIKLSLLHVILIRHSVNYKFELLDMAKYELATVQHESTLNPFVKVIFQLFDI